VCEGIECDTTHVDMVAFSYGLNSTPEEATIKTVYGSQATTRVGNLTMRSAYDPVNQAYYAVINDPFTQTAQLWGYNTNTQVIKGYAVPFGVNALNYDTGSKMLFATYGNTVYKMNPTNGKRVLYFQLYNANTGYSTLTTSNSAWNSPNFNIMVQNGNPNNINVFACFYIYTVNLNTMKTTISNCYPNTLAQTSAGDFTLAYMFQLPAQPMATQFLAVNFNVLGCNYDYIYPENYTVINQLMGNSDFGDLQWTFTQDPFAFTFNPSNGVMWGKFIDVYNNVILGGAVVNAPVIPTYTFYIWQTTTHIQVLWSASE